jgi:hypothetical protein
MLKTIETSPQIYARVAGFTFLFYIVTGMTSLALPSQAPLVEALNLLSNLSAVVLGVTLFMITSSHGPAIALLALACRILEAVHGEAEIFFAIGSTLFCWLFLRGRVIPLFLAWLGMIASILLVVVLPLQLAGLFGGSMSWAASVTWLVWMPMLVFEVTLALWLMIKGGAIPAAHNVVSPQVR